MTDTEIVFRLIDGNALALIQVLTAGITSLEDAEERSLTLAHP